MISEEQIRYLLPKACNAAIRAGAAIFEIHRDESAVSIELKSDMTPITVADRNAHSAIREYLAHTRIPLLSEEGREMLYTERRNWDLFWMVDPLDGTKEFIKGNGEFTVNISLMVDNEPQIGVIYVPNKKALYFSATGKGAFRKSEMEADHGVEFDYDGIFDGADRLPLVDDSEDRHIVIAVSRSHCTGDTISRIKEFRRCYPDSVILRQGSSYKLCLIAEGSVDYYPRMSPTYEWDTAAGEAILRESGGDIRELDNWRRLQYNQESLKNPYFECFSSRLLKVRRINNVEMDQISENQKVV